LRAIIEKRKCLSTTCLLIYIRWFNNNQWISRNMCSFMAYWFRFRWILNEKHWWYIVDFAMYGITYYISFLCIHGKFCSIIFNIIKYIVCCIHNFFHNSRCLVALIVEYLDVAYIYPYFVKDKNILLFYKYILWIKDGGEKKVNVCLFSLAWTLTKKRFGWCIETERHSCLIRRFIKLVILPRTDLRRSANRLFFLRSYIVAV
jgi:hypothetical protein